MNIFLHRKKLRKEFLDALKAGGRHFGTMDVF